METIVSFDLGSVLFSGARRATLGLLFTHPDEWFHLRQISRFTGIAVGAVQRETMRLYAAGLLEREMRGNQTLYRANPSCPIHGELKSIFVKTTGVADRLREMLAPLAMKIRIAFIFGSLARGTQQRSSDVDVMILGEATFEEVATALHPVQEVLMREVNPTVYSAGEFAEKIANGHHFLTRVMSESKCFLIGDENELAGLANERLAQAARRERLGDRATNRGRRARSARL
ncbi:MAG TPA: nucleotidyltransferase domain-containing protein [Tepidisphaeraceae bacterium]|nr:nucleotidyltransferase domain-containing protein [Tepidisphaeraceae bacterium]